GEGRNPIFFGEDLHHVGDDLQQPEGADAVGAIPVLPQAQQAALEPDQSGGNVEGSKQNAQQRPEGVGALKHGAPLRSQSPSAAARRHQKEQGRRARPPRPAAARAADAAGVDSREGRRAARGPQRRPMLESSYPLWSLLG